MTSPALGSITAAASMSLGALVSLPTAAGAAEVDDAITPYRPSVSSPAQLPLAGQLEFELGGLQAARSEGLGDTNIVLKRTWIVDDASAFGMEFGAKLPTAKNDIGSGKADYGVNTIYSRDVGPVHIDANFNATRIGLVDAGSSRTQLGASASFSVELSERWGVTGEVSGTHRGGADNGLQLLTALTFSPSKRLTFDIGVARALRPTPAGTQLFAGVVFPITKLW